MNRSKIKFEDLSKTGKIVKKRKITEANSIHIPLVNWFKKTYPDHKDCIMHFANEGKRSRINGAYLKMMGLRPGVSDLFLSIPSSIYAGFWIELKMPGKKPNPNQINFLQDMEKYGYDVLCTDSLERAKNGINEYMMNFLNKI